MDIVYAKEEAPNVINKSIFLVGPSPRNKETPSWRLRMIKYLADLGFQGTVFYPEPRDGKWCDDYFDQTGWEKRHLDMADLILAWVPRDLDVMPAFTTNIEFGRYVNSHRMLYGRPDNAPKTRYLDWLYEVETEYPPCNTMEDLAMSAIAALDGKGSDRSGGERSVPLQIWNTDAFQNWYQNQLGIGNRLDDARVLWTFVIPKVGFLFSYVLWVKVWIESEQRYKENEFIFSRSDISSVCPIWKSDNIMDSKVVLVKEFRSPVRNYDCFVHELPGGSKFKGIDNALELAAEELEEETGIKIDSSRFVHLNSRQLAATLSTHKSFLFSVELTDEEIALAEKIAESKESFGVEADTEKTYVEVKTVRDLFNSNEVDYSMLGMLFESLVGEDSD